MRYNQDFFVYLPYEVIRYIQEYVWLVKTIWQAGKITLEDLSGRWERSELNNGSPMPRSTFNRHRSAVQEIFGIITVR